MSALHGGAWDLKYADVPRQGSTTQDRPATDEGEPPGIRCPLCGWRPGASNRWCCVRSGTPEPPFDACGTVWNTFDTGGKCPGCGHQWIWTTCLRCGGASLHVDWYQPDGRS